MARVAVITGAGRGYEVLGTDIDEQAAARTAEWVGGFARALDVRDPNAHRGVARAAGQVRFFRTTTRRRRGRDDHHAPD
jgi:hypothetical protein